MVRGFFFSFFLCAVCEKTVAGGKVYMERTPLISKDALIRDSLGLSGAEFDIGDIDSECVIRSHKRV